MTSIAFQRADGTMRSSSNSFMSIGTFLTSSILVFFVQAERTKTAMINSFNLGLQIPIPDSMSKEEYNSVQNPALVLAILRQLACLVLPKPLVLSLKKPQEP